MEGNLMTMTAPQAAGIRGTITNSSDCLAIGRKLMLADLIQEYRADVKLSDGGSVFVRLSTGAFYEMDLA
jgi:hypothetical protein